MKKKSSFLIVLFSGAFVILIYGCNGGKVAEQVQSPELNISLSSDSKEVTIGKQVWMTENLDVSKFRNGDPIPEAKTNEEWIKAGENKQPAWYYPLENNNGLKYGKLYNWYAVIDPRGLAPEGWHIPKKEEWEALLQFFGEEVSGEKLKSSIEWSNIGHTEGEFYRHFRKGTNESNFSALPGGERYSTGEFTGYFNYGYWWSDTKNENEINANPNQVWIFFLEFSSDWGTLENGNIGNGYSVRCLKN